MHVFKLIDEDDERYYIVARDLVHAREVLKKWEPEAGKIAEESQLTNDELNDYRVTSEEFEGGGCPSMFEILQDYKEDSEGDIIASTL